MKIKLLLFLLLLTYFCNAQDFKSIIIETEEFDEPPTIDGRPTYKIEFVKNKSGDFIADHFLIIWGKQKKQKLKPSLILPKEDIDRFIDWQEKNKNIFTLNELGTNVELIQKQMANVVHKPTFPIKDGFVINTDTFNFCEKYSSFKTLTTGGNGFP